MLFTNPRGCSPINISTVSFDDGLLCSELPPTEIPLLLFTGRAPGGGAFISVLLCGACLDVLLLLFSTTDEVLSSTVLFVAIPTPPPACSQSADDDDESVCILFDDDDEDEDETGPPCLCRRSSDTLG